MTEGIKEALYCLFRTKSNKVIIPSSQIRFIEFLEKEAPELIIEKKEKYIDNITEQFVPVSAIIKVPTQKELKSVTPLTLAILFIVEGKYHTDKSISFNYDTICNLMKLEKIFSDEICPEYKGIFQKDFIKFANPDEYFVLGSDGAYNYLTVIQPCFNEMLEGFDKIAEKIYDREHPLPVATNKFTIGINTSRMISDHPQFYYDHPAYLEFEVTVEDYIDTRTGMVADHYTVYSMIKDTILERFGTGNINFVNSPDLRWRPTIELCGIYLYNILVHKLPEIITEITVSEVSLPSKSKISSTVKFNEENDTDFMLNIAQKIGILYEK